MSINWNYLFHAGATIAHPHFQLIAGSIYPNYVDRLINQYKSHPNIFHDLIDEEQHRQKRYLKNSGVYYFGNLSNKYSPVFV